MNTDLKYIVHIFSNRFSSNWSTLFTATSEIFVSSNDIFLTLGVSHNEPNKICYPISERIEF